ncbi:hypothetical protein PoB_003719600 [Plakobranchus ocellatus]|uniref:Uncharacterized protein n=1 Tax=Plakobranchus ocellatus TaxID=259542 RepID=A0AAV4AHP0_9GAST|nr:hypothetical protein PoB_003719600 [Plakobranchus ocellatus]
MQHAGQFGDRYGAQPRGHVARISSAVPRLPWSYIPSRGCGTSTGIDPSPIRRRMTSRLGSVGQRRPPISGEGCGRRGMMMSDRHYCRAVTTSISRIQPSPIRVAPHGQQGAHTMGVSLSIISSPGELRWIEVGDSKKRSRRTITQERKWGEKTKQDVAHVPEKGSFCMGYTLF